MSAVRVELGRCALLLLVWIILVPALSFAQDFATQRVAAGTTFDRPVFLTAPPGDFTRVFVVEQHTGQIRIIQLGDESVNATPFLTVSGLSTGNEQGLLGLAFHPDYAQNGLFYVNYTQSGDGATVVAEYEVSGDPDLALANEVRLLTIPQPAGNHNAGWIGFGPDDFLYIATGDGGSANDPSGNAQDITNNLLGKILRIDIDGDDFPADPNRNYAIPVDNPFVGLTGDDEIWCFGLRNPYRASFDRATGDLYIGDVGQGAREEIDVQPPDAPGLNWGWRPREGTISTPGVGDPDPPDAVDPIYDYAHGGGAFQGFSVTGGVVYRGPIAALQGRYFFADYAQVARIWSLIFDGSAPASFNGGNFTDLTDHSGDARFTPDSGEIRTVSAFGEDAAGNLYIVRLANATQAPAPNTGQIFRVPEPGARGAALAMFALALLARSRSTAPCAFCGTTG